MGQDHVVRTLKNAIARGRIAHAYLLVGPRGTGKTSTARIFAKALNCTGGPKVDFDVNDPLCQAIADGSHAIAAGPFFGARHFSSPWTQRRTRCRS